MAKLYGLLPSDIANRATTYDLMVTDILATYESYMMNKDNLDPEALNNLYDVNDLQTILDKTREQHS